MVKEHYKHINLESLRENTFDDIDIQKEIMHLFVELIDEYIAILTKELPKKNWLALFEATHKIKPNINMFGIASLEPIITTLDADFRNEQHLDQVEALVNNCIDIFKLVRVEIITELKSMDHD